ncbi:serine hydrolase-domain-containing protein [Spinellus fusiger]|nr:serine hydrolase-domain-containing protein [Spinellus fusiger]
MTDRKLKILCLHGFGQNATVFEKKCARFTKDLSGTVDFVYKTAPHRIEAPDATTVGERSMDLVECSKESETFAWWYPSRYSFSGKYNHGSEATMTCLTQILLEEGPFDGVMGFSQGAAVGSLLQLLLVHSTLPEFIAKDIAHPPFRFVIVLSGYKDDHKGAIHHVYKSPKLPSPSLHIIGETDTVVLEEASLALSHQFINPTLFRHPGAVTMQFIHNNPYFPGYSANLQQQQQQQHSMGMPLTEGMAVYPGQPQVLQVASVNSYGLPGKAKRKQVKNACVNCQKACKKCDEERPCQRCVKHGLVDTCVDSVRKERKKGVKRGPYKKRKQDGSADSSTASTHNPSSLTTGLYSPVGAGTADARTTSAPMHYPPLTAGPYDPFHAVNYQNSSYIMSQGYIMQPAYQQMYPTHPSMLTYQTAMHLLSPQQHQSSVPSNEPPPVDPAKQHASSDTTPSTPTPTTTPTTTHTPRAGGKSITTPDLDEEGSKLNLLSQLCSAVLHHKETMPKTKSTEEQGKETGSSSLSSHHSNSNTTSNNDTAKPESSQSWPLPSLQSIVPEHVYQQHQQPQ